MSDYTTELVENIVRSYFVLETAPMVDYADMKMDVQHGLNRLKQEDASVHATLIGVFAFGNSIHNQAKQDNITKMQVHRRLDNGLWFITNIMNGVFK